MRKLNYPGNNIEYQVMTIEQQKYIAFSGGKQIASGALAEVAIKVAEFAGHSSAEDSPVLVFDAVSSRPVDLDCRGSRDEIRQRYAADQPREQTRGRGRPKLGVVGKEVTLLPRHWEWLATQPGGASVALRRLIEKARKEHNPQDTIRTAQDATYNFMYAIAGNLQGFEEATRALYAGDQRRFAFETELWPEDVRTHLQALSEGAFTGNQEPTNADT